MGISRASTAEEAEALALLHITRRVVENNLQNLVIEGDNQVTINYLQGIEVSIQWQCLAILEEVKISAAKLVSFLGFQHVDRRANKVADLLAKKGRKEDRTECWLNSVPRFLIPSIAFDSVKDQNVCNINSIVSTSYGVNSADSVIGGANQTNLISNESESMN